MLDGGSLTFRNGACHTFFCHYDMPMDFRTSGILSMGFPIRIVQESELGFFSDHFISLKLYLGAQPRHIRSDGDSSKFSGEILMKLKS